MSTTESPESYRCSYCGGRRDPYDSVEGDRCSWACYYRQKGEGVINQIESDHQLCSTCYGRVKTVEPIPDEVYPAGDGFQYQTERTVIGVDEFEHGVDRYGALEATRWSCTCGAVDPGDTHADIQNIDLAGTIASFFRALEYLAEREAIPHAPSRARYFAALREHPRDAAYAAGRAVYG